MLAAANGQSRKRVRFEPLPVALQPERSAGPLIEALGKGARVLVVTNTVDRANGLLRAIEAHPDFDPTWSFRVDGIACPHHGRFAPADRVRLDAEVSRRFGRDGAPGPSLLVGTQTLEQSLDIDADLLITDLAPADVLLQRIGRLHRHPRRRPGGFERPRCLVLTPDEALIEMLDARGGIAGAYRAMGYGSVYPDLRVLALTFAAITAHPQITIPDDNRRLVEQTTHPERLAALDAPLWQRHGQEVQGGELMQAIQAASAVSAFDRLFGDVVFNEAGGKVATRLGIDTLRLPLDRPVVSPFGEPLGELLIPGHLAPRTPEETVTVEAETDEGIHLRCGDRHYRYTRFGLEKEDR